MSRTAQTKWKHIRAKAIQRAKANGQDKCPLCGTHLDYETHGRANSVEADHIIPHALGGPDHLDNVQILCRTCNRKKGKGTTYKPPKPHRAQPDVHIQW